MSTLGIFTHNEAKYNELVKEIDQLIEKIELITQDEETKKFLKQLNDMADYCDRKASHWHRKVTGW